MVSKKFYVPKFAAGKFLLKVSDLNSIESEIDLKKLIFLGRLITGIKISPTVKQLFSSRVTSFFDAKYPSIGVLTSICDALRKYDLFDYFKLWFHESAFPSYKDWKSLVKSKIREKEFTDWHLFCADHPSMQFAKACFDNISPNKFWSIADLFPDLVSRLHVQVRLMGNFGLNAGVPWLSGTAGAICFICKENLDDLNNFFWVCKAFKGNFQSIWSNLRQKILSDNPTDGLQISGFVNGLDRQQQTLLLLGGLPLPFDRQTVTMIIKFLCSAVSKVYRIRKKMLNELEAPWIRH